MSTFHYIASNYKLKTGYFGYEKVNIESIRKNSPTSVIINGKVECQLGVMKDKDLEWLKDNMIVYDSEYGGAGIGVSERIVESIGVEQHISKKYIYEVSPSWGHLLSFEDQDEISKKCVEFFVKYLKDEIRLGETIEFLTTWAGEETMKLSTIIEVDLSRVNHINEFEIQDRQLIRFTIK